MTMSLCPWRSLGRGGFDLHASGGRWDLAERSSRTTHTPSWRQGPGPSCPVMLCHGADSLHIWLFIWRSCVGDGKLFLLKRNMQKEGKLAHAEPCVMQTNCYLCLDNAKLKITRVALALLGVQTNHQQQQEPPEKKAVYPPYWQGAHPTEQQKFTTGNTGYQPVSCKVSLYAIKLLKIWSIRLTTSSAFPASTTKNTLLIFIG